MVSIPVWGTAFAIADDGSHVRVHGSDTGIPMAEVTVVEAPKPPPAAALQDATQNATNAMPPEISVLQVGKRLQITADVDSDGLEKLKKVLDQYGQILKLLQ